VRRAIRIAALIVLLAVTPPGAYVAVNSLYFHNLGTVEPGRVYRSGQMPADGLARTVRQRRIRTVLNLRGANARQEWYRRERAAALGAGATLVDVSMSSCEWMSRAQLRAVVRVLDTAEYPLLLHCEQGAERTGWVSAVAMLLRPGSTTDDAEAQFSYRYLFTGLRDGKMMREHLRQYERWLAGHGVTHSPERFRAWVEEGFTPGHPSREDWPYDPYPLVVITRPEGGTDEVAGKGGKERVAR
jgi:protein tyrosine phosphatase (PTP) superfamily phosphohydrolase (DUF442 family)